MLRRDPTAKFSTTFERVEVDHPNCNGLYALTDRSVYLAAGGHRAEEDAIETLMALGERRADAEYLLDRARASNAKFTTTDALVREMLRVRATGEARIHKEETRTHKIHLQAVRFTGSNGRWTTHILRNTYERLLENSERQAVEVGFWPQKSQRFWAFQGQFFWDDENLTSSEATALLLDRTRKKQSRIATALARLELSDSEQNATGRREPIPDAVKLFVWQRDGGKCVSCQSQDKLEFDHVIPLARGGSNTARNIQLLCEICNRAKGSDLT